MNLSWTLFSAYLSSKLDSLSPIFWLEENLIHFNVLIRGESNFDDKYVEKSVQLRFNWSEFHLSEMTRYKIHTLAEKILNKSNFWASQNTITQKNCLRPTLLSNYAPIPAPLLSVIEPGIFLHDLTFGLCFGLEGCEDNFDMLLFYLYAIELEERKNVRNICHVYPWHFRIFCCLALFSNLRFIYRISLNNVLPWIVSPFFKKLI